MNREGLPRRLPLLSFERDHTDASVGYEQRVVNELIVVGMSASITANREPNVSCQAAIHDSCTVDHQGR